eukprot:COSAG01_NODE_3922_length_5532_cov_16.368053_6_plen_320_part_00
MLEVCGGRADGLRRRLGRGRGGGGDALEVEPLAAHDAAVSAEQPRPPATLRCCASAACLLQLGGAWRRSRIALRTQHQHICLGGAGGRADQPEATVGDLECRSYRRPQRRHRRQLVPRHHQAAGGGRGGTGAGTHAGRRRRGGGVGTPPRRPINTALARLAIAALCAVGPRPTGRPHGHMQEHLVGVVGRERWVGRAPHLQHDVDRPSAPPRPWQHELGQRRVTLRGAVEGLARPPCQRAVAAQPVLQRPALRAVRVTRRRRRRRRRRRVGQLREGHGDRPPQRRLLRRSPGLRCQRRAADGAAPGACTATPALLAEID